MLSAQQPHLVLLHGWGGDSSTWAPLLPSLENIAQVTTLDLPGFGSAPPPEVPDAEAYPLDLVLDSLARQLPDACVLVGWSLGGMLAVQLAQRVPNKIRALVTLAANVKFVADDTYPTAMPPAVNREFNAGFGTDAPAALTLFSGLLVQGDSQARHLLKRIRAQVAPAPSLSLYPHWQGALALLAQLDNRPAFARLAQPGLHLLAERDALVPAAAGDALRRLNPRQTIHVVADSAHALHWSQPDLVAAHIKEFLASLTPDAPRLLSKQQVARSFSRAAPTYDAVAGLQRLVGQQLLDTLVLPTGQGALGADQGAVIVDLGSGTGFFTRALAQSFQHSHIIGLDLAEGMLRYAVAHPEAAPISHWVCGDAECLPLASHSVDGIFSSLAIQWCDDLPALMGELARILKPGGQLWLSTLGPRTLHELKTAWQQVDAYTHVNHFQPAEAVRSAMQAAGLVPKVTRQKDQVLYFERLGELTHALKALGAHNINTGKPEGLTGRARLTAFKQAYETFRTPAGLPASYDVLYFSASKPTLGPR